MSSKLRNASFILTVMVAAFLICLPLGAQVNTGRVSGQVTDQSAGAISGAKVTVIDVARGENRDLVSDAAGEYAAPNLLPGVYTVRAEFMGFETVNRENVQVTAGSDIHVDITLQPGATTQTVTVTEALPIVNTTNAQTGGTLDQQALSQLPINGRNYRWQANYVPGVLTGVGEGSSNQIVNGFPVTNGGWNMIFDGLISSTFFTLEVGAGSTGEGGDATLMPLDAIQEMQVVLNPKAEYGWAPGVTENVALKSGTNTLHGSAYAYGRGTFLDSKNPIANLTPPVNFEQFGGSAGGPIKKDKIFYFGAYEGARITTASTFTVQTPTTAAGLGTSSSIPDAVAAMNLASIPVSALSLNLVGCGQATSAMTTASAVATACALGNLNGSKNLFGNSGNSVTETENFPAYGGSNNGLFKIDYHVNDHHSLNGSIYIGRYQEYVVPNSGQTFTQPYWEELLGTESDMGRIVEIWTPNSNWLNQARVGVDHGYRPVSRGECSANGDTSNPSGAGASTGGSVGGVAGPNYLTSYGLNAQFAAGCGIPTISINGFTGKLGFANNRIDWENPISGADSVSYTHGTHQFKFGADVRAENVYGAKVLDSISGVITFGSTNFNAFTGATPLEDFLAGQPASEQIRAANSNPATAPENANIRHIVSDKIAFFAQDDWRIKPRLTLNLGFRYELETPERDTLGLIGNFFAGTPTGMAQTNQIFKTQLKPEPRLGFAYDVTGKGTTVVRGGGGIMYMIPQLMNYIAGGAGIDYGGEPTGAALYNANGTLASAPTGTITSSLITPTAITSGNNIIAGGNLPWGVGTALFPFLNPATFTAQCGNGLAENPANPPTAAGGANPVNPSTCTGQGGDPNLKLFPYAFWNLNVQHAFNNNLSLDVAYVGSRSWDLINTINLNQPTAGIVGSSPTTAGDEYFRTPYNFAANNGTGSVYPWFGTINYLVNAGGSTYAGLQLNLTARNIHGFTLNANYTLSHALVQTFEQSTGALANGNNNLDVTHHLSLQASYAVPTIRKVPGQMLEGWGVNGSINMLSALPVALTDSKDDLFGCGSSCADRWDLYGPQAPFNQVLGGAGTVTCYGLSTSKLVTSSGSPCITVSNGTGAVGTSTAVSNFPAPCQQGAAAAGTSTAPGVNNTDITSKTGGYNGYAQLALIGCYVEGGSALVPPAQGMEGTMYPNELRGKGFGLLNLSVTKNWTIKERLKTQFRWEIFNVLNRTQYAAPGVNLGTPSALGLAVSTPDVNHGNAVVGSGGPREMQLALRFDF